MELVGKINLERTSIEEYTVSFDVPDNCDYSLTDDSRGNYVVFISLIPPATSPSSTFTTHDFDTRAYDDKIEIIFDQEEYEDNTSTRKTKPVISITTNC
ncbi:MAG: hypothetical protein Q8K02_13285 [Flavobacterium sp.]|nr:hypothetical protein [Flavobacterium sp.]